LAHMDMDTGKTGTGNTGDRVGKPQQGNDVTDG
jgi:hypothetical protein